MKTTQEIQERIEILKDQVDRHPNPCSIRVINSYSIKELEWVLKDD